MSIFTDIWNWLKDFFYNTLQWVINLLPDSPFKLLDNTPIKDYLGYINYFVPFDFIVTTFSLWLVAIATYYLIQVFLRWVKAID